MATYLLIGLAIPALALSAALGYYYVQFSRQIEARLHGERDRVLPRVFARPLELRRGQPLGAMQVVDRLNDLGYAQRSRVEKAGEFAVGAGAVTVIPRGGNNQGEIVRIVFEQPRVRQAGGAPGRRPRGRDSRGRPAPMASVTLDPPLLTALMNTGREKRRQVPLSAIPPRMVQAVIAIEDRRFYEHPGIDPIRMFGAVVTNLRGEKRYLVGGSTLTQQLVKNFFLTPPRSRCAASCSSSSWRSSSSARQRKDEILELYLNEVYLGPARLVRRPRRRGSGAVVLRART